MLYLKYKIEYTFSLNLKQTITKYDFVNCTNKF